MDSITSEYGIGIDVTFELNEFQQPRIRSEVETLKDIVLTILFMKKGQYPSLPTIGYDIENMLYSFYDDIDVNQMKADLTDQCEILGCYFDSGMLQIKKNIYQGKPSLLIHIEGKEEYPASYMKDNHPQSNRYLIGITFNELNEILCSINSDAT